MLFLQMSNPCVKKLYCLCLRTMKLIIKGRSPTMRHVSRTHRVAFDWLFDRINLDPKIQIKYIDTNSQTYWHSENSHAMSGIICWICLTSAFSVLQFALLQWRNELNKDQEKNVSQPNRDPWWIWPRGCLRSCLLQLHQTQGWPRMDIKILENLLQVTIDRGNLRNRHHQVIQKRIMVDLGLLKSGKVEKWSSGARSIRGAWENFLGYDATSCLSSWRTSSRRKCAFPKVRRDDSRWIGEPDRANYQEKAVSETIVMGSDAAEFVDKVKDQVRNRQKSMSNVAESGEEHSIIWGMFMATTLNAATFMGKNFSTIQSFVKNYEDLTLKEMFDVTAQLVNNQDEINGLDKIQWEKCSWTRLSLIGDETVINLQSTKVFVFSDAVFASERFFNILIPTKLGGTELQESEPTKATETMMLSTESQPNSSGTSSQDSLRCSSVIKSMIYWATWDNHQKLSQEEFYLCSIYVNLVTEKTTKDECFRNAGVVKVLAGRFGIGQWSLTGPGSEKKWYFSENSPQGAWDHIAEEMLLEFAESGHPTFRATTPFSRGILKSKGRGKLSIHFAADVDTVDTIYRIIFLSISSVSTEQWQLYVKNFRAI